MATIIIHWKDKTIPPMEIKDAAYKGADSSIIKITSAGIIESHPHDVTITREAPNYSR